MAAIHQFLPTIAPRDAIGSHALLLQDALRELGFESEIYAENRHPDVRSRARDYRSFRGTGSSGATWLMYQASTGSPLADWLATRPEPVIMNYHNITPPEFFAGWEPVVAVELTVGRRQLKRLRSRTDLVIADSAFNAQEMHDLGYEHTSVVPIMFDPQTFGRDVDQATLDRLLAAKRSGGADLLFVGRIAPNKAQHDLVKLLAFYRKVYDPEARLHLVGVDSSHAYGDTIRRYAGALGLADAINFVGSVTADELTAYFQAADVFVSASEHEGFCVPLLEAMHHQVPIVAYGATAVPETLAGAGLVLRTKEPSTMAAAVDRVLRDTRLCAQMVEAGTERLASFDLSRTRGSLEAAIGALMDRTR